MRCPKCETVIPHRAKYCPKCGERAPAGGSIDLPRAKGALPSHAPLPRQGKIFLALIALAAVVLSFGIGVRVPLLIFVGAGAMLVLVLILLFGDAIGL